jgi:Tfp pilus assembly protein PilF
MSLRWLLVAGAIAALCACEMLPRGSVDADDALRNGIRDYEEGRYLESFHNLRNALESGLPPQERVQAHKYIAFIYCVSNRSSACREEFRKALAVDPSFQLDAAEAGHPTWGPVFRSLKPGATNGSAK